MIKKMLRYPLTHHVCYYCDPVTHFTKMTVKHALTHHVSLIPEPWAESEGQPGAACTPPEWQGRLQQRQQQSSQQQAGQGTLRGLGAGGRAAE